MDEAEIWLAKNLVGQFTCNVCAVSLEDDSVPKMLNEVNAVLY